MKKTIGYKVGSMIQLPHENSSHGFKTVNSAELRPFPSPKNDDWKSIDTDKSTKPSSTQKKQLKEVQSPPKESVEAVEQEKIELIRNMIREELSKEKKNFVKNDFKDVVLEQIQQINLELTKVKNHLVEPKSEKGLPLNKIDEVRILLQKEIKATS